MPLFIDPAKAHWVPVENAELQRLRALEARHAELVEAVRWERECIQQLDYAGRFWEDDNIPGRELILILDAARTEVNKLLQEPI